MLSDLITSVRYALLTIAVCAVGYPLLILTVAMAVTPDARMGSLVVDSTGTVRGSRLIAQGFSRPEYFWPRPSACGYDSSAAAGSNLSPANPLVRDRAVGILSQLQLTDGMLAPAELVTASGAGLDPHISYVGAMVQVPRVAAARGIDETRVTELVEQCTQAIPLTNGDHGRLTNVLELNLALDAEQIPDNE